MIIKHDHCSCSGSLRQRESAFCDSVVPAFIIFNITKSFINFQSSSSIEFHIIFNVAQYICSLISLKGVHVLISTFHEILKLTMVLQQSNINMLGDCYILYQMKCCAEVK